MLPGPHLTPHPWHPPIQGAHHPENPMWHAGMTTAQHVPLHPQSCSILPLCHCLLTCCPSWCEGQGAVQLGAQAEEGDDGSTCGNCCQQAWVIRQAQVVLEPHLQGTGRHHGLSGRLCKALLRSCPAAVHPPAQALLRWEGALAPLGPLFELLHAPAAQSGVSAEPV